MHVFYYFYFDWLRRYHDWLRETPGRPGLMFCVGLAALGAGAPWATQVLADAYPIIAGLFVGLVVLPSWPFFYVTWKQAFNGADEKALAKQYRRAASEAQGGTGKKQAKFGFVGWLVFGLALSVFTGMGLLNWLVPDRNIPELSDLKTASGRLEMLQQNKSQVSLSFQDAGPVYHYLGSESARETVWRALETGAQAQIKYNARGRIYQLEVDGMMARSYDDTRNAQIRSNRTGGRSMVFIFGILCPLLAVWQHRRACQGKPTFFDMITRR